MDKPDSIVEKYLPIVCLVGMAILIALAVMD